MLHKTDIMVIFGVAIIIIVSIYTMSLPEAKEELSKRSLQKVNITEIAVSDEFGFSARSIKVNQIILIQAEIVNLQNNTQPFVYIVKVNDQDNVTYSISYNKSELAPNDRVSVANSWIPTKSGNYTISIFLWSDTDGREVLAPKKSINVIVE